MRKCITRALYATAAAGVALSTAGFAGDVGTADGAPQGAGAAGAQMAESPVCDTAWSGYQATGRWFRFVFTTVTVPGRVLPGHNGANAYLVLGNVRAGVPTASITVAPGGGAGSVTWAAYPKAAGTSNGTPAATVVMSPYGLSDSGRAFGIWLRQAPVPGA